MTVSSKKTRLRLLAAGCAAVVAFGVLAGFAAPVWGAPAAETVAAPAAAETRTTTGVISTMKGWTIGVDELLFLYNAATVFYDHEGRIVGSGAFAPGRKVKVVWKTKDRDFVALEVHAE